MGQAIQRFLRAMSLRSDPGRLSLETGLTGTALWLAFLYLMQDGAVAAVSGGGLSADARPGGGAAVVPGNGPAAAPAGGGAGRAAVPAGEEPAPDSAAGAPVGFEPTASPGTPGGADRSSPASGQIAAASMATTPAPEGRPSGSRPWDPDGSGLPWSGSSSPASAATASPGPPSSGSSDPRTSLMDGPARPRAASGGPEAPVENPTSPAIPSFRVVVRSDDSLISRSVEGEAHSRYSHSLGAIRDAIIDLRDVLTPLVAVESRRTLTILALSVLDATELAVDSCTVGLDRSILLLGSEANDIRLRNTDAIDMALVAGGGATAQILQSLIGLLGSRLEDAGGGGSLELSSLARIRLHAPGSSERRQIGIDLRTQAMQDSAILLGDGDDLVTIASGFEDPQGGAPGLLLTLPAPGDPSAADAGLQVRARAYGLVNSRLEAGGGDDVVGIRAWLDPSWLDPTWRAIAETVALRDSVVELGEGDDRLSVEGTVAGSRIAPGSGVNDLAFTAPVIASTLALTPASGTAVRLGDGDDALTVELVAPLDGDPSPALTVDPSARLDLATAGGDDRIVAPLGRLGGILDGGGGADTLVESPARVDGVLAVQVEAPGRGTIGTLHFSGGENLVLGDGESLVAVAAGGSLDGMLEGGGGRDGLDYGAWREPVLVDLARGEASGILSGISGFETVRTGSGDDWIVTAAGTRQLETGDGDDRIDLNLGVLDAQAGAGETPLVVSGGAGHDRFVLAGMEAIRLRAQAHDRALPVLADLERSTDAGIGLTDAIAWRLGGLLAAPAGDQGPVDLTPAGLEGIGQPRLLPIAPLEQLVSGMETRSSGIDQLAIATGNLGSRLVLLGSDRSITAIAELPALRSLDGASGAAGVPGPAPAA
jgi:hypothetical protein